MKKNVWIWNHYATDMFKDQAGRHYWFAEYLMKEGYKPTIFCASTDHFSGENIDTKGRRYARETLNSIPFLFINTPNYTRNDKKRIYNIFSFYRNLFPVAIDYAKLDEPPDVILASSVHPLTLVAGIKVAQKFGIPCICEVRDLWPESIVAYGILKRENPIVKLMYQGEKWIYKRADSIIMTWEGGKDYIINQGWSSEVDLSKITYISSVPNELREKIMLDALQWGIELYLIPRVYEIMLKGAEFSQLDDSLYFRIKPLAWDPVQRFIKRAFDIVLALTGFLLGWWLFPIIALAIRLDSPGPVIYSQVRAGRDNRLFKVHKFRTMIDGAERLTGPVMASANDPRITKVGSFLRKTRLDELPQLWNVLKGEMSFVGPRPERPNFIQEFARMNPSYNYRMKVKPGITGLAQVKGNYSTDFRDKLKFDLLYIRNYSIFLDLQIIANTLQVIFTPKKAEGTVVEQSLEYKKEVAATEQ